MSSTIYFSWQLYKVVSIILILQMSILALREVVSCSVVAKLKPELLNATAEQLPAPSIAFPLTRIKISISIHLSEEADKTVH